MKKINFFAIILCFVITNSYCLADNIGTTPFNFLRLDTAPRPAAMGGAFVGLADDVNAINYNPAGLSGITNNEVLFMHTAWLQGIRQEYFAFATKKGFGGSLNIVDWGTIRRTTLSNKEGYGMDDYLIQDMAVTAGWGEEVKENISYGINLKYISENIDFVKAESIGIDIGGIYQTPYEPLRLGAVLQNLGTRAKYKTTQENLPLDLKLGTSLTLPERNLILALDSTFARDTDLIINFGAEYLCFDILALRVGYNGRNQSDSGATFGLGINSKLGVFDCSFAPYGDLGSTYKISLKLFFHPAPGTPQPSNIVIEPPIQEITVEPVEPEIPIQEPLPPQEIFEVSPSTTTP